MAAVVQYGETSAKHLVVSRQGSKCLLNIIDASSEINLPFNPVAVCQRMLGRLAKHRTLNWCTGDDILDAAHLR